MAPSASHGIDGAYYSRRYITQHRRGVHSAHETVRCHQVKGAPDATVKLLHCDLEVTGSSRENSLSACRVKAVYINFSLDAAMTGALCTGLTLVVATKSVAPFELSFRRSG
ncbi:hypothetical protein RHMOL_Rhmol01G0173500 [Rhododendron molle]|uniref:Uncharacterized protein n=1 Tax=Rhododendron molle TaxID=49168 RepID=A0ACC0Q269_RHOML|nr:hypothetical protein RHMOL_Rhmol01G0173500 [Rhododendron molle]